MIATERTLAADRGDIQAGATRDKTPGFDPAAAPQETDAEAAGTPSPASPREQRVPDSTTRPALPMRCGQRKVNPGCGLTRTGRCW